MSDEILLGIDIDDPENRLIVELTDHVYDMLDMLVVRRMELGLTRSQVAKQIGVREDSIERLENYGDSSIFLLKYYAFTLGMTIDFKAEVYENNNAKED